MLLTLLALWVHCQFTGNWMASRIPWIPFCKADIQLARLQPVLVHGVILLICRTLQFPLLNIMGLRLANLCSLLRSLWKAPHPPGVSATTYHLLSHFIVEGHQARHDFPRINPQGIPSILIFMCLEMISRIFCFIMFTGIEVRLQFSRSSLLPLWKLAVTLLSSPEELPPLPQPSKYYEEWPHNGMCSAFMIPQWCLSDASAFMAEAHQSSWICVDSICSSSEGKFFLLQIFTSMTYSSSIVTGPTEHLSSSTCVRKSFLTL